MRSLVIVANFCFYVAAFAQESPCSYSSFLKRYGETEEYVDSGHLRRLDTQSYMIPVVLHVFHHDSTGRISREQALSGLKILNDDFNGYNDGWDTIDPEFDSIKSTLNIKFLLATLDPSGNPTSGINYYNDRSAMTNDVDLFQYAWDNYKYLNIYLPKYVFGGPSNYTGYASFPRKNISDTGKDGLVISSVRWGFGDQSSLEAGDDWASIVTHEMGHWLNLYHPFQGGCEDEDQVSDTPPTLGGSLELDGCYNQDFSCGVRTNGENFMDYNHRCKKMFTKGQVERMTNALHSEVRRTLWGEENLKATGSIEPFRVVLDIYQEQKTQLFPNPSDGKFTFQIDQESAIKVYSLTGDLVFNDILPTGNHWVDLTNQPEGVYLFVFKTGSQTHSIKAILK